MTCSSSWHDESVKLHGKSRRPDLIKPNQQYLDELIEILPYVENGYFAGGEPLLQPEHYFLLRKLKEIGNTNVDLSYATNFTLLFATKYDVLKHWDGFKSVEMMASIDGTHKRGDLMRKNQEWDTIVANRASDGAETERRLVPLPRRRDAQRDERIPPAGHPQGVD